MDIQIKKLDLNDPKQIEALVGWDCDKELYPLVTPARDKIAATTYPNRETALKKFQDPGFSSGVFVIWDGDQPIGNLSIQVDPPHLMRKLKGTSWLGLLIGERKYWGTGAAAIAMEFFEQESLNRGRTRIELGTFEFNTRAQGFYKKLGYTEIGRLRDFTYFDNRFWDDIRMEKLLRP